VEICFDHDIIAHDTADNPDGGALGVDDLHSNGLRGERGEGSGKND
jgi:hypothetical protein